MLADGHIPNGKYHDKHVYCPPYYKEPPTPQNSVKLHKEPIFRKPNVY